MGMDFIHLEYAGEFWDELLDQSIIDGVRPTPYFVRQGNRSILVDNRQARVVKEKVAQMKKDARRMNISLQCENIDKLTIKQMFSGDCDNRRCYITRTKVTIDPTGNVLGCSFFGDWILGNIRQQDLKDIWNNDRHKRFMKHFARRDMKLCRHCIMGVQRNPTPAQNIRDYINRALGRARI
jgi:MoaA/NifB/PqqE/SkfB family radical SAM enzyme